MGMTLLLICGVTNAATSTHNYLTKDEVIDTYLNAVLHGKLTGINNAIDNDAQFTMTRGDNMKSMNKQQVMEGLKSTENIEQDCKSTTTVIQDDDEICIRKVDMKYGDYTRTDVITAQHVGNGWKITKVETSYK